VRAIFFRNARYPRSIELRRIKLPLPRIIFVAREINDAGTFIHRLNAKHLEIALRDLMLELGIRRQRIRLVEAVEIKLRMPIAPA
jgi:hypothetical protein